MLLLLIRVLGRTVIYLLGCVVVFNKSHHDCYSVVVVVSDFRLEEEVSSPCDMPSMFYILLIFSSVIFLTF